MPRAGITPGALRRRAARLLLYASTTARGAGELAVGRGVGGTCRHRAGRRCDGILLGHRVDVHAVDDGIDTELVDQGLAHDVGVVARPEGLREPRGGDAQGELAAVEGG